MAGTHQSSNHDDTDWKTVPQSIESDITIDALDGSPKGLTRLAVRIELAHHHIRRVGHHGAKNTSQIAAGEGNRSLRALVVLGFVSRKSLVDHLHNGLERGKLHHRVGDLATPEWVQTLVQTKRGISSIFDAPQL